MKRQVKRIVLWSFLSLLTACAPVRSDRIEPADMEVRKIPSSIASVSRADAYLENGRLVVSGNLRRMHEVKLPGHVDIILCGPEGLLERKTVTVSGLSSKRKGAMNLPFMAHFDLVPPPGAKIVIRYHAPPFSDERDLKCV